VNPGTSVKQQINVGRYTVIAGCVLAVLMAIAFDNIKGKTLFDIFQSILGYLAPPLAVTFLLSVFWKRTTKLAVNLILSAGSAFSLFVGMLNLWILPPDANTGENTWWPHYFLISFYIFLVLFVAAIVISLLDTKKVTAAIETSALPKTDKQVKILFALLGLVILSLYIIFNGH
jgi:SSS family solute:Na+ symporter